MRNEEPRISRGFSLQNHVVRSRLGPRLSRACQPCVEGWRGWVGGTVENMGPAYTPDGLGRMPNPGLAGCAGQRMRASFRQAPTDGFTACPADPPAPAQSAHTSVTAFDRRRTQKGRPGQLGQRDSCTRRVRPWAGPTAMLEQARAVQLQPYAIVSIRLHAPTQCRIVQHRRRGDPAHPHTHALRIGQHPLLGEPAAGGIGHDQQPFVVAQRGKLRRGR